MSNAPDSSGGRPPILRLLTIGGVALWLLFAFQAASVKSAAMDEVHYIGAGLALLEFGDARMTPEHPPLVKIAVALPVWLLKKPPMEVEGPGWRMRPWFDAIQGAWGFILLFHTDEVDPMQRLFLARLIPILIGLCGGLIAYLCAISMSGGVRLAGLCAAALLLFYPEWIGHASLATMDVPLAVGCALVAWRAQSWWKRPNWQNTAWFALAAAIASLIKLPGSVFVVLVLFTMLGIALFVRRKSLIPKVLILIAFTAASGWFAAWAGNGFRFSYVPEGSVVDFKRPMVPPIEGDDLPLRQEMVNWLWEHKLLPETALSTMAHLSSFENKTYFLLGEESQEGFYGFFFVTYFLKTPIPYILGSLFLFCIAAKFLTKRSSATWGWRLERNLLLWLPFLLLFLMHFAFKVNIGHRHVLFIYFPISVSLGVIAARGTAMSKAWKIAAGFLLASQIAVCVYTYPHFSTYFNMVAGGPLGGSKFLRDSNADWGQDVNLAAMAITEEGYDTANLALFGLNEPFAFGILSYNWINVKDTPPPHTQQIVAPDPSIPTIVSVNYVEQMRQAYPTLRRDPDLVVNSLVIWLP